MTPERPQVGDTVEWCGARFTVRSIDQGCALITSEQAEYRVGLSLLTIKRSNPQGVLL